jgi:hypothetical protein
MGQDEHRARAGRRRSVRHNVWKSIFEDIRSLYSDGWESAEASFIREQCEEQGLLMGYGRIGREPEQIAWANAAGSDDTYDASMPDEMTVTVADGVPSEAHPDIEPGEAERWECGDFADGTWKDAPEALIVKPGQTVKVVRRQWSEEK